MTNVLTLRIKKKYFDQIASGQKTVEYRANKKFYKKLSVITYSHVIFHYQSKPKLICEITKIELIKNFLTGAELKIVPTKRIYAIHMRNPKIALPQDN